MRFNEFGIPREVSVAELAKIDRRDFEGYVNGAVISLSPDEDDQLHSKYRRLRGALENFFDVAMALVDRDDEIKKAEIGNLRREHAISLAAAAEAGIFECEVNTLRIPSRESIWAKNLYDFVVNGIHARLDNGPHANPKTFAFLANRPFLVRARNAEALDV